MESQERREALVRMLGSSKEPISGSKLAALLGVSRQVIVQDIALLRAANLDVISTTKGYIILEPRHQKVRKCFTVNHLETQIEDELCTIIDAGGKVLDVIVVHPVYGEISVELILSSRKDIQKFIGKISSKQGAPLMEISNGIHVHTVEADSMEVLQDIEEELKKGGYFVK